MQDLTKLTIREAHDGLVAKKFLVADLILAYQEKITEQEKDVHAFLWLNTDLKNEIAKAQELINGGEGRLLTGIPMAIKDNILVDGIQATAGSKILANYIASYDATVITKLKNQGAILLGKTNMDEFAMGSSNETSAFGPTKNPRDLSRVPGGSSGGSAASVSADEAMFALGSDTGGSIRQPAGFCGVVGLKPTYGRVSRYGLMSLASSLDQIGPLTKTVEDSAIILQTIASHDTNDFTSSNHEVDDYLSDLDKSIVGMKIGVPKEYFSLGLDAKVKRVIKDAIGKLEKLGAKIVEVSLPMTDKALATYYIIQPAEASANLARYTGLLYGNSQIKNSPESKLKELYEVNRGLGFGDEVKRRIMMGTYVLSAGFYDAYYSQAKKVQQLIREDFAKVFEEVDILITPTTPTIAFKLGDNQDPLSMHLADVCTVAVNIAGLPALSLPVGEVDGLPVGAQLIGKWWDEKKILNVGHRLESSYKLKVIK